MTLSGRLPGPEAWGLRPQAFARPMVQAASLTMSAIVLFALVLAVRWLSGSPADVIALLFTVPIALLAVTFGTRGGAVAAMIGTVLLLTWTAHADVHLTALGWAARVTPFLVSGVLLGAVVDRLRSADAERHRLAAVALRHREAIEINDTFLQRLTAAKWSLESGDSQAALAVVSETLVLGHQFVSDLVRDAGLRSAWTGESSPTVEN